MNDELVLQVSDNFDHDFDLTQWTVLERYQSAYNRSLVRCEGGYAILEAETTHPAGPGVMSFGGFATKEKYFNPGLSGTNIFEISLIDYTYSGDCLNKYMTILGASSEVEDPVAGLYLMGWGITIGNFTGFIGSEKDRSRDRAVQFHFDGFSKMGLYSFVNRSIIPEDIEEYPRPNNEDYTKTVVDTIDGHKVPYISRDDATILGVRHHPSGTKGNSGIEGDSSGHRYGIQFSDDGKAISWMLDGKIMDTHDITGYFSSVPGTLDHGLYISIGAGGSYQRNLWTFDDAKVHITK